MITKGTRKTKNSQTPHGWNSALLNNCTVILCMTKPPIERIVVRGNQFKSHTWWNNGARQYDIVINCGGNILKIAQWMHVSEMEADKRLIFEKVNRAWNPSRVLEYVPPFLPWQNIANKWNNSGGKYWYRENRKERNREAFQWALYSKFRQCWAEKWKWLLHYDFENRPSVTQQGHQRAVLFWFSVYK